MERQAGEATCVGPGQSPLGAPGGPGAAGRVAGFLRRRGLEWPAILLVEVASPFRLLIQQALWVAQPALSPWLGDRLHLWAGRLDDDRALEEVRRLLE